MTESLPNPSPLQIRKQLSDIVHRLFERKLFDMSGGNISIRCGDRIIISPRYSGSKKHWQLSAEDFIEGSINNDELLGHPLFSREGKAHLAIYREIPIVNSIIHAHSYNILPFAAKGIPIPPVLEGTQKFGVIQVAPYTPAHSSALADQAVKIIKGQQKSIEIQAAAVILPQHGILIAGKDVWHASDALERIDWNAWCLIAMKMLG